MGKRAVRPGIEQFVRSDLTHLRGKRIALLSNYAAVDSGLTPVFDTLGREPRLSLSALLAPEHGLRGEYQAGENVPGYVDQGTGLPVISLYDQTAVSVPELPENMDERMRVFDTSFSGKRIDPSVLKNIDTVVLDLQDIGTRIYTYISTMGSIMKAVSGTGKNLIILDRPNPVTGTLMEGPVLEYPEFASFVGFYSLPVRHAMTVGELAMLFNGEMFSNSVNLTVVPAEGWKRNMWFDSTGMTWVNPSPNMPSLSTAAVYPGFVFMEGTNVSEGRGTTTPFELFGAPWINAVELTAALNSPSLPGVVFRESYFSPSFSKYSGSSCQGARVFISNRETFRPFTSMLHVLSVLRKLYPDELVFFKDYFNRVAGNRWLLQMIEEGNPIEAILPRTEREIAGFNKIRSKYLLYP